jgi:hypothetical protein
MTMAMPTSIVVASSRWKQERKPSQKLTKHNQSTLAHLKTIRNAEILIYCKYLSTPKALATKIGQARE